MFFWIFLLSQVAFSYVGRPLEVQKIEYQPVLDGPSCGLLMHRHREREKVIREIVVEQKAKYKDDHRKFMRLNYLSNNKYFIDKSIWQDLAMEVSMSIVVPPSLKEEVVKRGGFQEVFLSLKGVGAQWSSKVINFPEEFEFFESEPQDHIDLKYLIYQSEYCFNELVEPQLSWISLDSGHLDQFFNSSDVAIDIHDIQENESKN